MNTKFALITCSDGNFIVRSEWSNLDSAIIAYHTLIPALMNDKTMKTCMVKIVDENLDLVEGKMEYITHEPVAPAPVVEEEPVEESEPTEES